MKLARDRNIVEDTINVLARDRGDSVAAFTVPLLWGAAVLTASFALHDAAKSF
jgi:hypothetical protein